MLTLLTGKYGLDVRDMAEGRGQWKCSYPAHKSSTLAPISRFVSKDALGFGVSRPDVLIQRPPRPFAESSMTFAPSCTHLLHHIPMKPLEGLLL